MPRVLLVSPLPGLDPPNGDVTYTLSLLENAPEGFHYVTYDEALASGELRERARRRDGLSLATVREAAVNRLRKREFLFREPFRFFDVEPNAFDLIHCHAFSARFSTGLPLVISSSAAPEWLYQDGEGWGPAKIAWARFADRSLARLTGVEHLAYRLPGARRVISWSNYLRDWYIQRRVAAPDEIDVVPPGIEIPAEVRRDRPPQRLLFVGHFEIKGGDVALKAFEIVHRERPETSLTVVGTQPRSSHAAVTWLDRLPRERLLGEVMPEADIFIYPTRFDGLSLTLVEAMASGLPAAASNYRMIPEVIGGAGLTCPVDDPQALARNVFHLLEPETHSRMSLAAREHAIEHYARDVTRDRLLSSYSRALSL